MEHARDIARSGHGWPARLRIAVPAVVLALAALPAAGSAADRRAAQAASGTAMAADVVPGEVLVRFDAQVAAADRADARREAETKLEDRLPVPGLELLRVRGGTSVSEAVASLEQEPGVLYAEPNLYRSAGAMPRDPYFGELWGLHNTGQPVQGSAGAPDADIDAPEAWDVVTGDPSVTVAIVDSGILRTHPDLAPNTWANPGESGGARPSNGVDDDRNGYVDDVSGWDWVQSDADPTDLNGHGTHVAGTVAARGDNATGVSGVSWRAGLMGLRVLDDRGNGTVASSIQAYRYAGSKGARVLNASLGGPSFSQSEYDAIRSIPSVLFVAAAGNDGRNNDSTAQYPCNYELANIVCVAATGQRDALAGYSNYGARTVDLAAPGSTILSTWLSNGYAYSSGTSMATPHVAGVAALAFAQRAAATAQSAKAALLAGVDVLPSLAGRTVTGGRLNAYTTIVGRPAPPPPPAPAAPAPATPPPAAAPDRTPPQVVVSVRRRQRLRTLLRRGIRVTIRCSEACRVRAHALIGRRSRRGQVVAGTLIMAGRQAAQLTPSGKRVLRIRLRRSAKRRLAAARRPRLTAQVTATDAAGNTRTTAKRIRVRRSR